MRKTERPTGQLALDIGLSDEATLDSFLAGPEQAPLLDAMRRQADGTGDRWLYLCGPPDCGKSHLLQAACHREPAAAIYLPLGVLEQHDPAAVLDGVERVGLVALDDLQRVAGRSPWELALFRFLNLARERSCRLLLAADRSPRELPLALEDLRSRLSWGPVFRLAAPDERRRRAVLQARAERRGIALSQDVVDYILSRAPRSLPALLEVLERIDRAALAAQRPVSLPLVKRTLGW
jgi:DnaA family protein